MHHALLLQVLIALVLPELDDVVLPAHTGQQSLARCPGSRPKTFQHTIVTGANVPLPAGILNVCASLEILLAGHSGGSLHPGRLISRL